MCLLLIGWKADARFPLVLAANRDEFYGRPTAVAAWWQDHPEILAGRDLQAGGTWLGLQAGGRLAALTNFREPGHSRPDARSRGALVQEWLSSSEPPEIFAERLLLEGAEYNGFNLIFGELGDELYYFSNRSGRPAERLLPGFHGLSNHLLDTPWPKVVRGVAGLKALLGPGENPRPEPLFALLADQSVAEDAALPETGVGLELERVLSPMFIRTQMYGTRCSTLLLVDRQGNSRFLERSFGPDREVLGIRSYELRLPIGNEAALSAAMEARL